jgi:hypothetical protein
MAGSAVGRQGVHVFADDAKHHFIGTLCLHLIYTLFD